MTIRHFFTTCTIILTLAAANIAWANGAQKGDQGPLTYDDLPEFCVAALLVTEDQAEASYWRETFRLDWPRVTDHTELLTRLIKDGHIEVSEIEEAAMHCRLVRQEFEKGEEK